MNMIKKVFKLVEGKVLCESGEVQGVNELCDNFISRFEDRVSKEITVYNKRDAFYITSKLLDRGVTDVTFEISEDGSSYRFARKESEESDELEIEGEYVIE